MVGNITLKDIFISANMDKITGDCDIARTYNVKDKKELCIRIAGRFFDMILTDVVNNKGVFYLTQNGSETIKIKKISSSEFIDLRKKSSEYSALKDVDPMKSEFSFYKIVFKYLVRGFEKEKEICVCKKIRKQLTDNINNKVKFDNITKLEYEDYVDKIKEHFELIHDKSILYIIKYAGLYLKKLILFKNNVNFTYRPIGFSMYINARNIKFSVMSFKDQQKRHLNRVSFLEKQGKYQYDGYYYFKLNEERYNDYINTGKVTGNIILFRIKEYIYYECSDIHIFRVKKEKGTKSIYLENYEESDTEYVSRRNKFRFRSYIGSK